MTCSPSSPWRGDGIINGPEECDNGNGNLDLYGELGCSFFCTKAGYCGDGIVQVSTGEGGPRGRTFVTA